MTLQPNHCEDSAPAKINLALHVVGQRADGYHLLDSLVAFADIGDRLKLTTSSAPPLGEAPKVSLDFSGPFGRRLSNDSGNLVLKAAEAALAATPKGTLSQHLDFHLEKNLPVASGIGGGSADAAAALRMMKQLAIPNLQDADLHRLALKLGADIPMCLASQPARVRGIGENLQAVAAFPKCPVVLVNPGVDVRTPAVFKKLTQKTNSSLPPLPEGGFSCLQTLFEWLQEARNDLEAPAQSVASEITATLDAVRATDHCRLTRMSGSGATCFGLYEREEDAEKAAQDLQKKRPGAWVRSGHLLPSGAGATA